MLCEVGSLVAHRNWVNVTLQKIDTASFFNEEEFVKRWWTHFSRCDSVLTPKYLSCYSFVYEESIKEKKKKDLTLMDPCIAV